MRTGPAKNHWTGRGLVVLSIDIPRPRYSRVSNQRSRAFLRYLLQTDDKERRAFDTLKRWSANRSGVDARGMNFRTTQERRRAAAAFLIISARVLCMDLLYSNGVSARVGTMNARKRHDIQSSVPFKRIFDETVMLTMAAASPQIACYHLYGFSDRIRTARSRCATLA